jgi:serine/threonine protein kinase
MVNTVGDFVESLRQNRLLEPDQLDDLTRNQQTRYPDPRSMARHLIQVGWLTPYQVNQVLTGKGQNLMMGSYAIMERLGEGGMGIVFKARNWKLGRVVALKIIRREHVANNDAVRRFRREIQAVANLSHPNIVSAHDADQVGDTHFFVMEYVDGNNLSNLLKQAGPPPVSVACDYIRQVASGLQQAHERGMVHRDIKPANLLVTKPDNAASRMPGISQPPTAYGPTIKILDMGVARLIQLPDDHDSISALTKEGRVVGTPDYMAPEQAVNSAKADIRADLYSLGCTFYQLLTNQPPFPGGTPMEKLLKHRIDQPKPLEQLRPEVPPAVASVVRKLMAKKVDERYQTPAEVVQALDVLIAKSAARPLPVGSNAQAGAPRLVPQSASGVPVAIPLGVPGSGKAPTALPIPAGESFDFGGEPPAGRHASSTSAKLQRAFQDKRNWPLIAGAAVTLVLGLIFILIAFLTSGSRR